MKQTPLIISIVALVVALASIVLLFTNNGKGSSKEASSERGTAAPSGEIVYIQLDSLVINYDMYNDLMSAFQSKAQSAQEDLEKKGRKLESDGKAFENQINKGLLTRSSAEQQQANLLQRQEELQNEAAQKQAELQEEEYVLNNRVMDAIQTYIKEYNRTHNYSMILTSSASSVVIDADPSLDITKEIIEGLNAEYVKNRNK